MKNASSAPFDVLDSYLPEQSVLNNNQLYDYVDAYQIVISSTKNISADALAKAFFSSDLKWIKVLFEFRNKIVAVFGLKTGKEAVRQNLPASYKVGTSVGLFKILEKTENEIIMGENDRHLDFKVSLLAQQIENTNSSITVSTVVNYHNWFGKFYFFFVKPFHKRIVPVMLKKMATSPDFARVSNN